jgi:hypothetical protein
MEFPHKTIPLHDGQSVIVNADDFDDLVAMRPVWSAVGNYGKTYAACVTRKNGKTKTEFMHRVIFGRVPDGMTVDHINGNSLDNRRENLRLATRFQNGQNRAAPANNTSGYKGVHWLKSAQKWQARIKVEGKRIHLGVFENPEDAFKAYCRAAELHHGEFANTGKTISTLKKGAA